MGVRGEWWVLIRNFFIAASQKTWSVEKSEKEDGASLQWELELRSQEEDGSSLQWDLEVQSREESMEHPYIDDISRIWKFRVRKRTGNPCCHFSSLQKFIVRKWMEHACSEIQKFRFRKRMGHPRSDLNRIQKLRVRKRTGHPKSDLSRIQKFRVRKRTGHPRSDFSRIQPPAQCRTSPTPGTLAH